MGCCTGFTRSPSPPPWRSTSPSSKSASLVTHRDPPSGPRVTQVGVPSPPSLLFPVGVLPMPPLVVHYWGTLMSSCSCSWGPSFWVGLTGGMTGWNCLSTCDLCLDARGMSVPHGHAYSLTCVPIGEPDIELNGFICAKLWLQQKDHVMAIISEPDQNVRTVLVSKNHSTPSRCTWPNPTNSLTMSSSWKESGLNGVSLPGWQPGHNYSLQFQVHHLESDLLLLRLLPVDTVDILMWGRMDRPTYVGWR